MMRDTSVDVLPTGGDYYCNGPLSPVLHMTDEGEQVAGNYIVINTIPADVGAAGVERMVIDTCRNTPPLPGATRFADGTTPWDPALLAQAYPAEAPYLLRAAWLVDGERVDGWVVDMPVGADVIESGVVPHGWA